MDNGYGYLRISEDPEGLALGVERQEKDIRRFAKREGVKLLRVFCDNDISASTLSNAPRPEYAEMLDGVRAGKATVVIGYSNSRLTRRPRELEDLIDLHRATGVRILTVVSGEDDLSTADGRMVARIKANVDAAEAERTGERVKRQKQQRLESGLPLGSRYRTFGYGRDWAVKDDEAFVVREVFKRVASGESVNSITRDLVGRGTRTASGGVWRYQATVRIVESPIYAGLLSYKGDVVGKAAVPALITEAQYEAAQGREKKPAWNTRKHLLSGIAICDNCKTAMNHSGGAYVCSRMLNGCGNVKMKASWLDDAVNRAMTYMTMWSTFMGDDEPEAESADEDESVADIDRRIQEAQEAHTNGDLALADLLPILKGLREKRAAVLRAATVKVEHENYWQPLDDYENADLSLQRAEVAKHIRAIVVRPARRGLNQFDPERFDVVLWNGDVVEGPLFVAVGSLKDFIPALNPELKAARDADKAREKPQNAR